MFFLISYLFRPVDLLSPDSPLTIQVVTPPSKLPFTMFSSFGLSPSIGTVASQSQQSQSQAAFHPTPEQVNIEKERGVGS